MDRVVALDLKKLNHQSNEIIFSFLDASHIWSNLLIPLLQHGKEQHGKQGSTRDNCKNLVILKYFIVVGNFK